MRNLLLILTMIAAPAVVQASNIIRTTAPISASQTVVTPPVPEDPEEPLPPEELSFSLKTSELPQAKVGHPYDFGLRTLLQWQSNPSSQPMTWISTALQDGLVITGEQIVGTPLVGGSQLIDIRASLDSKQADKNYILNIMDVQLSALSPQQGMAGKPFELNLKNQIQWLGLKSGQDAPSLEWKIAAGSALPSGLTLSKTGAVSGTPNNEGDYSFTVESSNNDFTRSLNVSMDIDFSSVQALQVASGSSNTCILTVNKTVKCWGYSGLNGDGTTSSSSTPVDVINISNASYISYGYNHGCAIASGDLYCWGNNAHRQIGNGTTTIAYTPYRHTGLGQVVSVDTALYHTCAANAAGDMYCWGNGTYGRVGNGNTAYTSSPAKVTLAGSIKQVATSMGTSYALSTTGEVYAVGYSSSTLEMIPGYTSNQLAAVKLTSLGTDNIKVEADMFTHRACVLKSNQSLVCWGEKPGNGTTSSAPVAIALPEIVDVQMGGDTTCVLLSGGAVRCWGDNETYKLNNGTTAAALLPVEPNSDSLKSGVVSISPGTAHMCIASSSTATRCWGTGSNYRLGMGNNSNVNLPTPVPEP